MPTSEQKQILRKNLKAKRLAMDQPERQDISEKITKRLLRVIDWKNITNAHIYKSIENNNEVNTRPLIKFIKEKYPKIKIYIPKIEHDPEPALKNIDFDLFIVPILGFDRHGYRLGYGSGYYDKLLANHGDVQKIGLAYSISGVEKIPYEPHDQKLDMIITEKEIISI
jgi:5-formyltetrahydrofolate cyclo-ligase